MKEALNQLRGMWLYFRRYPTWGDFEKDYRTIRKNYQIIKDVL